VGQRVRWTLDWGPGPITFEGVIKNIDRNRQLEVRLDEESRGPFQPHYGYILEDHYSLRITWPPIEALADARPIVDPYE